MTFIQGEQRVKFMQTLLITQNQIYKCLQQKNTLKITTFALLCNLKKTYLH